VRQVWGARALSAGIPGLRRAAEHSDCAFPEEATDADVAAWAKLAGLDVHKVNLGHCEALTDTGVEAVATHCTGLQGVIPSRCTAASTGLKAVILSGCRAATDTGAQALATHCTASAVAERSPTPASRPWPRTARGSRGPASAVAERSPTPASRPWPCTARGSRRSASTVAQLF